MRWQDSNQYDFCGELDGARWAWEFLRRNPLYRSQWQEFNNTWQQLEAEYGAPPHRDMQRWRADPRAWRAGAEIEDCDERGCVSDGNRLAIECWLGARWGFYKFPMSPDRRADDTNWDMAWRELDTAAVLLAEPEAEYFANDTNKIALGFDLAQPLASQFDDARRLLGVLQRQRRQAGMMLRTVANLKGQWLLCLRLLDAGVAGATEPEIVNVLSLNKTELPALLQVAHDLMQNGYRRIAIMK